MALKDEGWRLELEAYPMRLQLQTRYGDMDPNAHLNNVAIARLIEEARVRFHYGIKDQGGGVSPSGVMIVHASIDYLGQGQYPDDVDAGVGILSLGGSSYRLGIGLFQRGKAFALAESVMVNVDAGGTSGAKLPPDLRQLFESRAMIKAGRLETA